MDPLRCDIARLEMTEKATADRPPLDVRYSFREGGSIRAHSRLNRPCLCSRLCDRETRDTRSVHPARMKFWVKQDTPPLVVRMDDMHGAIIGDQLSTFVRPSEDGAL
jgi:hypothetical protein